MRRIPKYSSEHNLYEQIAQYLQQQYPDVIYRFDLAADLKLTPGQAAKHHRLHPERGYPDLYIAESSENINSKDWNGIVREWGFYFGLYIEIKKDGTKLKRDKDAKKLLKGEVKIRKKGDGGTNISKNKPKCSKDCVRGGIEPNLGLGLRNVSKLLMNIYVIK